MINNSKKTFTSAIRVNTAKTDKLKKNNDKKWDKNENCSYLDKMEYNINNTRY